MPDARSQVAADALHAAQELEVAAAHLRTAARHVQQGEVPRYAAHLLAAHGHLLGVQSKLNALALLHAARSVPQPRSGEDEPS
ncbi:hypothetical protein [Deinococcus sp. YIM 77859]|uniref:hypothetical protein n=1 Tax=Deinococcus sp. YIM 77859 TaxID=1540221 RepID=UPI000555711F|nr:hypothetical protein [Deinococcus sp. YIM 77859]